MIEFDLFSGCREITHGSFSRLGGTSLPPYDSLNVCYESGDDLKAVKANCRTIQNKLQISHLIQTRQCHGNKSFIITDPHAEIPPCDALITNCVDIGLMIKHADCQAALFYDPIKRVIASVHAGWRGSCAKIYTETILTMHEKFGTKPSNLLVAISPSLGREHAEFINYRTEFPQEFWDYQIKPNYFDFWAISYDELISAGVLPHHIQLASLCTYANENYFSYRRDKAKGRLGSVIGIKK